MSSSDSTQATLGIADSDTAVASPADAPTALSTQAVGEPPALELAGYRLGARIGLGGMGEVLIAHDERIGRDVAVKRMRMTAPTPDLLARFWREAKIQARLDHPAIVPVHQLGHDAAGLPYFTMKRLAGTTLYDVLHAGEPAALTRLLRAFVDVCLAIEFAHVRRVVHRDLKPSNIMVGDYGEVYVLDWGIARALGDTHVEGMAEDISTLDGKTQVGAVLGTPGYMSPEQVRGDADINTPTDVYALGTILFEILAGEPLHPYGGGAIASTLSTPTQSPAARAPDRAIAPELDAACLAALAEAPADRPTARALADRVQRYLDGDRDIERRRAFAADQLALAREAASDPSRRAEAMRVAGRALAIDHESVEAARLVTQLLLEPPAVEPAGVAERVRRADHEYTARSAKFAGVSFAAYFLFFPLLIWAGITAWTALGVEAVLIGAMTAYMFVAARLGWVAWLPVLICNCLLAAILGRIFGPFIFVPGAIAIAMVGLNSQPGFIERPVTTIGAGIATFVVPMILEQVGVLASTWSFVDHRLVIHSAAIDIAGTPAVVLLVAGNIATVLVSSLLTRGLAQSRRDAHRRLETYAWHLAQLLPVDPVAKREP